MGIQNIVSIFNKWHFHIHYLLLISLKCYLKSIFLIILDPRRNNLVSTNKILVANDGKQTSSKMSFLKRKNKVRRHRLKSLRRRSNLPEHNFQKQKLYDQIIQSYKDRESLKLKRRIKRKKKLLRKKLKKTGLK